MEITVTYIKNKHDPENNYYEWTFKPPLKGDCGFLIMTVDGLKRGKGDDGPYQWRIGEDSMAVIVKRYYPDYAKREDADGVFYHNDIKLHGKTIRDKLSTMMFGQTITLTTWDEEHDQKEIRHDLSEIRNYLNREIQKRQGYGLRSLTTTSPGYALLWSNGQARWMRQSRFILQGETLSLDANEIFAPYTEAEIDAVVSDLAALPLYAYSFEGKGGIAGRPEEELRQNLEKLESELEIAVVEEDKVKQRNIIFTMDYIKSLLKEGEEHLT